MVISQAEWGQVNGASGALKWGKAERMGQAGQVGHMGQCEWGYKVGHVCSRLVFAGGPKP